MAPHRFLLVALVALSILAPPAAIASDALPSLEDALKEKRDVWGEAAMRQTNGPSYEFFSSLLPPPRYVNADFRYYPIVLSAPNTKTKARLISNGSGLNLSAGTAAWSDNGTPAIFRVGPDQLAFGTFPERLQDEPTLTDGYLPIVELRYLHQSPIGAEGMVPLDQTRQERPVEIYKLEAFAPTEPTLAEHGVVLVRFSLAQGTVGTVTIEIPTKSALKTGEGKVTNEAGRILAIFDKSWKPRFQRFQANLAPGKSMTMAVATKPLEADSTFSINDQTFDELRAQCAGTWRGILAQGTTLETPEPVVNNAWRHLLIQNFELINGDRMHYSQGNQYDKIYESEGSDAALAMLVWGFEKDARRLMVPLLDFTRKGLEFHQAGFKLNDVCRLYWQTRDPSVIKDLRSWSKPESYRTSAKESVSGWAIEAERLDKSRTGPHGLYPLEQYCGDIHTPVQTINAASKAWRAMRDLSAVLAETGQARDAEHYARAATEFRQTVLTAIEKSADRSTEPPFIPVALYTNEPAHDPICDVRIGSYWNIIIGYTIGSGVFPPGSEQETWLPHYQEQHGGLFMGMLRSGGMSNSFWNTEYKVNPLYGTRYAQDALRRDDVDRALVCFYGMLAQGFTKNTFESAEGASLVPSDPRGRLFYLPPNSAANSHLLSMLRYMLVQDSDLDDDGKPETLRLGFATPQRWLEDGKGYDLRSAPSAFGLVSLKLSSRLSEGKVDAEVELPARNAPSRIFLRARVPDGWAVTKATVAGKNIIADEKGTIDITGLKGKQTIEFAVQKADSKRK